MLVFEDLHWADEAMLAFLEHLADRAEAVPLLVVGTARPELYERHPDYANGLRNANTDQPVAALRGGDRPAGLGAARDDRDPRRAAAADPGPGRREPPLRRGVRPAAQGQGPARQEGLELGAAGRGRGPVPRLGAGPDRRPPGHARARRRSRCSPTPPSSGKVFWAGAVAQMGERDLTDGHRHPAGALAQGARASRPSLLDRGRGRVRVLAHPDPRRRLRPAPASLPGRPPRRRGRAGSSPRLPNGSRTSPTCSPTTTRPPWSSPGPPGRPSRPPSSRHRRLVPRPRRGARARPGHRRGAVEPGAGARARPAGTSRTPRGARPLR